MALLDQYEHLGVIGTGYFSLVKLYKHKDSGQEVAVKVLKDELESNEDYVHRFEREVELLRLMNGCENIIPLLAHEFGDNKHLYVMPAADSNLADYIAKHNNTLSMSDRLALFDQVLKAIQQALSKGVIHRDISPRNVLLFETERGQPVVRVSDFGLAKNVEKDSGYTRSVVAQYGQMYYVAPEQYDKLKAATEKSEVFSLGKLLDFTLTGKIPVIAHQTNFRTVVERATQEEPSERYATVGEFQAAYERLKALLIVDDVTEEFGTPATFTGPDGAIDWKSFHSFALNKQHYENVYHEYLGPVMDVILDPAKADAYVEFAGDALEDFVRRFCDRLDELPSVGWPFSATTQFGEVFQEIFYRATDPHVKLRCLVEVWKLAYEQDQWGCQTIMNNLLESDRIPPGMQTDFAVAVLDSKATLSKDSFSSAKIPDVIRRALRQKAAE
ncbi:MAG TPA: serine/threonine-protein kinase [Pyrinomonadaceae bacterium]|nr:serine/threonine-protein kinase [Pyrinomonadaceae bacterium]